VIDPVGTSYHKQRQCAKPATLETLELSILSIEKDMPWKFRLVVGTGAYGNLAVTEEVKLAGFTAGSNSSSSQGAQAIESLKQKPNETNAILHVTC
jgi:hypothetical protein